MKRKRVFIAATGLITALLLSFLAGCSSGEKEKQEEEKPPVDGIVASLSIETPPTKTDYAAGESFSPAGMKVVAIFTTGEAYYVQKYITITPSGPLSGGTTFVTVKYRDKEARVNITVTVDLTFFNEYSKEDFDTSLCSFYDKFEGNNLDKTKWGYQNGGGGWGNKEEQNYQGDDNASVQNGILSLKAEKRTVGDESYASAKLVTATGNDGLPSQPFSQTYGRFEAKIRLSKAEPGMWPAFWMMPVDSFYGGWPSSGEIDIMEMRGSNSRGSSSAIHWKPNNTAASHKYRGANVAFPSNTDITQWHIYSVRWERDVIIFLIDGMEHTRVDRSIWYSPFYQGNGWSETAPFDKNFFLILNLAVGGHFDNYRLPQDSALPISLDIDWVRCYTLEKDPWPIKELTLSGFTSSINNN